MDDCSVMTSGLSQLCLTDSAAITLAKPEPDYFLHIDSQSSSACGDSTKVACTSTNNTVRIYTRTNLAYCYSIHAHSAPLSGVRFSPSDPQLLYTSSADGTIRCWDLREKIREKSKSEAATPSLQYSGYNSQKNAFTTFDVSCDGKILCAGTEEKQNEVFLIFWDCRKSDRLGVYSDCHQDDVTQVRFHPLSPDLLLSGGQDGLVCQYNIAQPEEDEALIQTYNTDACLSRVGWCGPEKSRSIYATTTIDSLHVWDPQTFDPVFEIEDTKERLKDRFDYLVDCFEPRSAGDAAVHALAGSYSGSLRLLRADVTPDQSRDSTGHVTLEEMTSLRGGSSGGVRGHSEVVRCMHWDATSESLVTGGEDGLLCMWRPPAEEYHKSEAAPTLLKAKSSSKIRRKDKMYARS